MDIQSKLIKFKVLGAETHTIDTDCGHKVYVCTDNRSAYILIPDDVTDIGFNARVISISSNNLLYSVKSKFALYTGYDREIIVVGGESLTTTKLLFADICAKSIDFCEFSAHNVINMDNMFMGCELKDTVWFNNIDTSNVISMKGMFNGFSAESLCIEGFDTGKVRDMEEMFAECRLRGGLDLGRMSRGAENMAYMFDGCCAESITLGQSFDTSHCTAMNGMFSNCHTDTLDIGVLNTSEVTDMSYMFMGCETNTLDFGRFDTSNVRNMAAMFARCDVQSLGLNSFDTSKVTDMSEMFSECKAGSIDLGSFKVSDYTDLTDIFDNIRTEADNITITDSLLKREYVQAF